MSDKYLTEKEWKSFSKNPAFKDAPLIKALAAVEKAAGAEAQIKALDELDRQADLLLKAHRADKPLAHYLSEMDKAAKKQRKEAEKALDQAATAEDDEPGSALLDPKRLLAELTLCRRDPERTVQFGFVDAGDKEPAVLALGPKTSGRKLFATLQAETGVKTGAYGSAWVDDSSLMLQLDKPMSGLVKKIRAPVKACGFRISKVVLWNADGSVFEQDEAGADGEPGEQGEQGEAKAEAAVPPPQPSPVSAKVAFTQSRLAWDKTRKLVQAELRKLEATILEDCADEPDFELISGNSRVLYTVLDHLDERLIDKLDEALNATTPELRRARQQEAREIVDEYLAYVASDRTLKVIANNGFIDVNIMPALNLCLGAVAKQLKAEVSA